jgi:hypothetical protein
VNNHVRHVVRISAGANMRGWRAEAVNQEVAALLQPIGEAHFFDAMTDPVGKDRIIFSH